jgi:hypothetical protein
MKRWIKALVAAHRIHNRHIQSSPHSAFDALLNAVSDGRCRSQLLRVLFYRQFKRVAQRHRLGE